MTKHGKHCENCFAFGYCPDKGTENECKPESAHKNINIHEKMRLFIFNAIFPILNSCGNSYSNAWCEHLLRIAKEANCYHGEVIGNINDLKKALNEAIENGEYKEFEQLDEQSFNDYLEETKNRKEQIKYKIKPKIQIRKFKKG